MLRLEDGGRDSLGPPMLPFSLKRKAAAPAAAAGADATALQSVFHEEDEDMAAVDVDDVWNVHGAMLKRRLLEDEIAKAHRLKQDGIVLAESERFKAAIGLWNQALYLTPHDATLHEMKSQALNELCAYFPAIQVRDSLLFPRNTSKLVCACGAFRRRKPLYAWSRGGQMPGSPWVARSSISASPSWPDNLYSEYAYSIPL